MGNLQYFFGVCVAFPVVRVTFWLWERGSYWVVSPTEGHPFFLIPRRIHLLRIVSEPHIPFSFSSLIEFPSMSSPIPSYEQVMMASSHTRLTRPQVFAVAAYSKGFACSAGPGRVLLFDKVEEKDFYHESKEIRV